MVLVDFDYRTKSTSGNVDNMESGLQNLWFSQLNVFQPARGQIADPIAFMNMARALKQHLKANTSLGSKTTVHIWFSFAAVMRFNPAQHDARLNVPEDYFQKLVTIFLDIQKEVASPILVCLLPDGEFHGVSTYLSKVASSFDQQSRSKS